jgi:hypothetical protein
MVKSWNKIMTTGENANAWVIKSTLNGERLEDAADGFATVAVTGANYFNFYYRTNFLC